MDVTTDLDAAVAAVGDACVAVDGVRAAELWRLSGRDLLDLSIAVERLSRLVFATQVSLAGELDTQKAAADHGCASTAALLRQTLAISASDAKNRVDTAQAVLPRESLCGGDIAPVLPLLGEALSAGVIGVEQIRTIVASMKQIPSHVDDGLRELCQKHLMENGILTEPKPFANFARAVIGTFRGDDEPDEDRSTRIELFLGARNPATGMTRFHGQLDDLGVEVVSQAIDALAKPCPASSAGTGGGDPGATGAGRTEATGAGRTEAAPAGFGTATDPTDAVDGATGACGAGAGGAGEPGAGGNGGTAGENAAAAAGSGGDDALPDSRSAACRRGQALIEALRRFLDQGTAPIQGGQRPHITVTVGLEELRRVSGRGVWISVARSVPGCCGCWRVMRRSSPRCSGQRRRSSMSAGRIGCSRPG